MADIKAKAPIIILIILIVISLGFAGLTFHYLQQEHQKNTVLQGELEDIKTKYSVTETKLKESQKTISGMEDKLNETKLLIESLEDDLNKTIEEKQDALSRAKELESSLEGQMKLRAELENKLVEAQSESKKIKEQVRSLESQKAGLETKIKELEQKSQSVELGKIIVGSESEVAAAPQSVIIPQPVKEQAQVKKEEKPKKAEKPVAKESKPEPAKIVVSAVNVLEGKVLVVNKEYDFAVIDLGSKDGIEVDNVFSVYQNKKYMGDLRIEKVHESMAAAGFLSPKMKDRINEGDRIVQKKK